jgi:hypothetical protein
LIATRADQIADEQWLATIQSLLSQLMNEGVKVCDPVIWYQVRSATGSLALKKIPPIPVTFFV